MSDVQADKNHVLSIESADVDLFVDYQKSEGKLTKGEIIERAKRNPTQFKYCYRLITPKWSKEWRRELIDIALKNPEYCREQLIDLINEETQNSQDYIKSYLKEIHDKGRPRLFFGTTNVPATTKYETAVNVLTPTKVDAPIKSKNTAQLITASLQQKRPLNAYQNSVSHSSKAAESFAKYQENANKLADKIKVPTPSAKAHIKHNKENYAPTSGTVTRR